MATATLNGKLVGMVSFSPYPHDPRPRRTAEALLKEGMSVDVICLKDGNSPRREVSDRLNIRRLSIEHHRGGVLSYTYQYSAFILASTAILALRSLKRRYDLIYVHNMPDILVLCALIPKLMGAKVILDQHDPIPELMATIFNLDNRSLAVRVMEWLEKWSIARANRVITVNIACQRIFTRRSRATEKIGVVMNAPDEAIFGFNRPRPVFGGRGAPEEPLIIMYHGSIVERNGLDLAVDALALVRSRISAQLRIYGHATSFLEKVIQDARSKGLQDQVQYLGPRRLEELAREIEGCSLGIIPNHRNPFSEINTPTRIFEYLALGRPVIVPRTAGIRDYFDEASLLFFEPGSAKDLAARITYAMSHPAEVAEILQRGQNVYQQHRWVAERLGLIKLVSGLLCGPTTLAGEGPVPAKQER